MPAPSVPTLTLVARGRTFLRMAAAGAVQTKGFGSALCLFEVLLDGSFEFGNALEDAAPDAILGDQAEEALDLVEPGCRGRREVHVEARMAFEPSLDRGVLVGARSCRRSDAASRRLRRAAIDGPQETQPFLVTMALHALADHACRWRHRARRTASSCHGACSRASSFRPGPSSSASPVACGPAPGSGSSRRPRARARRSGGSR